MELNKSGRKHALPVHKKSNADVLKRYNSTPIVPTPEQTFFPPFKRCSAETAGAESVGGGGGTAFEEGAEIAVAARLAHRALSDGIEINVRHDYVQKQHTERDARRRRSLSLGSDGPDFIVRSWHPVYRGLIVTFCLLEGVGVVLAHHEGLSEYDRDSILLVVWAMWPLCGMFVSSIFLSDLREEEEVKFPICELFCFVVGGYFPWMYSGAFGFTKAFEGTSSAIFVQIGSVFIGLCLLYFLWEIRRQMRNMNEEEVDRVVKNNFSTISYSMLPIVYLTLESIGWILLEKEKGGFGGPRNIVKVNFVACMHIFCMTTYQTHFSPVQRYKLSDMLKGKVPTQVAGEAVNFICTTSITLFVLATKTMDSESEASIHIVSYKSEEVLESFHIVLSYCFGCMWTAIFIVNGWKFFGYFGGNKIVPPNNRSLPLCSLCDKGEARGSRDSRDSRDSRRSISNASSGRGHFVLGDSWRLTFALLPCFIMPSISIMWIGEEEGGGEEGGGRREEGEAKQRHPCPSNRIRSSTIVLCGTTGP
jgi:hypothetical protein